jgi:hypothetical protein
MGQLRANGKMLHMKLQLPKKETLLLLIPVDLLTMQSRISKHDLEYADKKKKRIS